MARHAATAEPTEYCVLCKEWHWTTNPIHRRPIRRLLSKLRARAATIRRQAEQIRRLQLTLEQRVKMIQRMQVVWDMAELFLDQTATTEERWAALDTIREAIHPSPVVDLEDETEAMRHG